MSTPSVGSSRSSNAVRVTGDANTALVPSYSQMASCLRVDRYLASELDNPSGAASDGEVDELAIRQFGRLGAGALECIQHGVRPFQLAGGWGEHVVEHRELTLDG